MPSIEIQIMEGVFSDDEKRQIIERVTDAFASVAGQMIKAGTSVRIQEIRSGSWGYAGNQITTEIALEMKKKG